ncbi:hypothetical protein BGZ82_007951 [Podila clonocystis]|nr:hypothetical protein BGZ82_007951 [Podila clonocystis]
MNRSYRHCFLAPLSHNALLKYSPHIRVLTCRGHDILVDLLRSDCSNLLHINYLAQMDERFGSYAYAPDLFSLEDDQGPQVADPSTDSRQIGMGLSNLTKLIARNPHLRAVSIEIPVVETEDDVSELTAFVASLDQFPSVTCFYIEASFKDPSMRLSLQREILRLRLDALGRQRVKHLTFRRGHRILRINRGQPDGLPLGRYGPWRGHRARSMEPQETLHSNIGALAVQDSSGTTVVCLPCEMVSADLSSLLARYCQVRCLNMERLDSGDLLCQLALPEWRTLHHFSLDMTQFRDDNNLLPIHGSPKEEEHMAHFPSILPPGKMYPTQCLRHALVEVYFQNGRSNQGSMSYLLDLLTSCPNLQALRANYIYINGSEPTPCPPWSTYQLRSLSLGLLIEGFGTDSITLEAAVALATASADRIALAFMDQLGRQTDLRELQLQFNNRNNCGPSPFLDLAVGPKNGLGQLTKLARLESLVITGLTHSMGSVEMEWVAKHWPRLQTIELPLFDPDNPIRQANRGNYERAMLDWTPWFPRLDVRVPYHNLF